jgi:hypothetical protein
MLFGIYIVGYLIGIGGLTYVASLMHVPTHFRPSPGVGGCRNFDGRQVPAPEGLGLTYHDEKAPPVVSAGRQKN